MPISGVYSLSLLVNRSLPLACRPQNMFKVEKVNCISVDWKRGAKTKYTQAVHNIRVVGAEIAFFIQNLSVKPCLGHILWGAGREGPPSPEHHLPPKRQPKDPRAWGRA